VHFGQVPAEHWHQPPWIDEAKATEERNKMIEAGIPYGEDVSCVFPLFWSRMWVFLMMDRTRPDIATCVDSTPGCDQPPLIRPIRVSVLTPTKPTQFFFRHPLVENFRYYWRVEWVSPFIPTHHPGPFDLV
jgi:hypothetical protein